MHNVFHPEEMQSGLLLLLLLLLCLSSAKRETPPCTTVALAPTTTQGTAPQPKKRGRKRNGTPTVHNCMWPDCNKTYTKSSHLKVGTAMRGGALHVTAKTLTWSSSPARALTPGGLWSAATSAVSDIDAFALTRATPLSLRLSG